MVQTHVQHIHIPNLKYSDLQLNLNFLNGTGNERSG